VIVDASVVLRWFLNEPGAADAASVFEQTTPLAPALILAEVGNGLWSAVRRKRIEIDVARAYLRKTPRLFGELRPTESLYTEAFELACELDHPIYDCLYLAMAAAERAPLLTVDLRLQAKVAATRWRDLVSVLTP
jgi:predicted nucleic acid-binding protein